MDSGLMLIWFPELLLVGLALAFCLGLLVRRWLASLVVSLLLPVIYGIRSLYLDSEGLRPDDPGWNAGWLTLFVIGFFAVAPGAIIGRCLAGSRAPSSQAGTVIEADQSPVHDPSWTHAKLQEFHPRPR